MVEVVEEEEEAGRMEGVEIFFITDNPLAEAVCYEGKSSDKGIFELMLWLVYLEPRGCFRVHIIWVQGTKRIAAGIYCFLEVFGQTG